MRAFTDARDSHTPDQLWLLEHPPVYTLGQAGDPAHLLDKNTGIDLIRTDRGGQITFHGPGQVIAYLLLDLRRRRLMARELVRRIEQAVIETLAAYNLSVCRKPGAPGLYIDDTLSGRGYHGAKIAALGLKIRRGCCYHGVSLNVNMDLRPFDSIHPCGDAGLRTVDMASLGVLADWSEAASLLASRLQSHHAAAYDARIKQKAQEKTARIPIKIIPAETLKKPDWIRVKAASGHSRFYEIKRILRAHQLHTVCEEASCPNIGECFGKGTATFMIMGDKCTRRCPFCDVGHGRPDPLDANEPDNLARTIAALKLEYVVITSVDRDDLLDGGAAHFVACIERVRALSPSTKIEILTPDFRGRLDRALSILNAAPPDVINHNLETVPRLYKAARPGAHYLHSLNLLKAFKDAHPEIPTKSGLMVGLGEEAHEILDVMSDLRDHHVDMLTIGQYLQPSAHHLPVRAYIHPDQFKTCEDAAYRMGFTHAAVGAMVRSSYHADAQAHCAGIQ